MVAAYYLRVEALAMARSKMRISQSAFFLCSSTIALCVALALAPTQSHAAEKDQRRPFGYYDGGSAAVEDAASSPPKASTTPTQSRTRVITTPSRPAPGAASPPQQRSQKTVRSSVAKPSGETTSSGRARPYRAGTIPLDSQRSVTVIQSAPPKKTTRSPARTVATKAVPEAVLESEPGSLRKGSGKTNRPTAREDKSLTGVDKTATQANDLRTVEAILAGIQNPQDRALAQAMVSRIMNADRLHIGSVIIDSRPLRVFYRARDFQPAWVRHGQPLAHGNPYIRAIRMAEDHGLNPNAYGLAAVMERAGTQNVHKKAEQELLIAQGLLDLAQDLKLGRVKMSLWTSDYMTQTPPPFQPLEVLKTLAQHQDPLSVMAQLAPKGKDYRRLQQALLQYRTIAAFGDWPRIPSGETLRINMQDRRVPALRKRLMATGDLPYAPPITQEGPVGAAPVGQNPDQPGRQNQNPNRGPQTSPENPSDVGVPSGVSATSSARPVTESLLYDITLAEAVKRFQARNGLAVDGSVGSNTRKALNVSVHQRIGALAVNMDRLRAEPRRPRERSILVNVPAFDLKVVDAQGRKELDMRVIVGRASRQTTIFHSTIWGVVLNPYWNVPTTIAVKDLMPKAKANPDYLSSRGYKMLAGWSHDASEVNWEDVDWNSLGRSIRLRQNPGAGNALGRMKFRSTNPFAIYLHDTPNRKLFHKSKRAFSSGCIRLHRPNDLAKLLLTANNNFDSKKMQEILKSGKNTTVRLDRPVPLIMLYHTSWVDGTGLVQFREDLYSRDRDYRMAMGKALAFQ